MTRDLTPLEQHAHATLTDQQFAAFLLWNRGAGYQRVADQLGISRSTAVGRIRRAMRNLGGHIDQETPA